MSVIMCCWWPIMSTDKSSIVHVYFYERCVIDIAWRVCTIFVLLFGEIILAFRYPFLHSVVCHLSRIVVKRFSGCSCHLVGGTFVRVQWHIVLDEVPKFQ